MAAVKSTAKTAHTVVTVWQLRPAPLILLTGKEQAIAELVLQTVRQGIRQTNPELEIHDIDAKTATAGELITLASPSLFSEARLIRVSNLHSPNDAFMTDLAAVIPLLDAATTIVLRHEGGNGGRSALQLLRNQPATIEVACEVLKDNERAKFVVDFLTSRGFRIETEALHSLTSAYAADLAELLSVAEQLARDSNGVITVQNVETLTAGRVETNALKIADAAAAGHLAQALILLRHGLYTGQEPLAIHAALTSKLRLMAKIYGATSSDAELAKQLKQHPYAVKIARRDVRYWREANLAKILDFAAETEWLLKGGARDKAHAIENFVLAVAKRIR